MDRNRNRVTGPDVQGQRDRDKEDGDGYGHTVKTFGLLQPYFGHLSCIPAV